MTHAEKSIEVDVPVSTAYNQWTQFESFPNFMRGVKHVRQIDDRTLHWLAEISGKEVEWTAEITHQEPDRHIGWRTKAGTPNSGSVTFAPAGANRTRVTVRIDYTPEGAVEKAGSALGVVGHRIEADLGKFKEFIERRGVASGAWRGEIRQGEVSRADPGRRERDAGLGSE
jgi:uncharacterized membrane protein